MDAVQRFSMNGGVPSFMISPDNWKLNLNNSSLKNYS